MMKMGKKFVLAVMQMGEKLILAQLWKYYPSPPTNTSNGFKQCDLNQRGNLNVGWRNVFINASKAFFSRPLWPLNFTKRIGNAWESIVYNPDTPILSRYSWYSLLDQKRLGGGIFGSLGYDCLYTMFWRSMITANSYIRIEHTSETRPTVDGEP